MGEEAHAHMEIKGGDSNNNNDDHGGMPLDGKDMGSDGGHSENDGAKTLAENGGKEAGEDQAAQIPGVTITVFGMSTEGYEIARASAIRGATVFIIDESNPTAILLSSEVARTYPDISSLREDEPILLLEPLGTAVSKSDYLFFAPRMRMRELNIKSNTESLFRDVVQTLREGSSVVLCVPAGIGNNSDYVSILQHSTGLEVGHGASYYYYPVQSGRPQPRMIGSADGGADGRLAGILSPDQDNPVGFISILASEYAHTLDVLSRFSSIRTVLELASLVPDESKPEISANPRPWELYVDEMTEGMLDARMIELSLDAEKLFKRSAMSYSKEMDAYARRVVMKLKQSMRAHDMPANRTRAAIIWSFDPNLMRGEKNDMAGLLLERLNQWIDVVDVSEGRLDALLATESPVAVIACSERDFEMISGAQRGTPRLLVVKATPLCEVVAGK